MGSFLKTFDCKGRHNSRNVGSLSRMWAASAGWEWAGHIFPLFAVKGCVCVCVGGIEYILWLGTHKNWRFGGSHSFGGILKIFFNLHSHPNLVHTKDIPPLV